MSILIKGMTMPEEFATINVWADGHVYILGENPMMLHDAAIELPDHGVLIDRDAMAKSLADDVEMDEKALDSMDIVGIERQKLQFDKDCKQNCMYYLTEQEAVIPAERSEE